MQSSMVRAEWLWQAGTLGDIEVRGGRSASGSLEPRVVIEQVDLYQRAIADFLALRSALSSGELRGEASSTLDEEELTILEASGDAVARALAHARAADQCFFALKHARTIGEASARAVRRGAATLGWPDLGRRLETEASGISQASAAFDRQATAEGYHLTAVWVTWAAERHLEAEAMSAALERGG